MKKLGKKVIISLDSGYDGSKVTVNGVRFDIPKTTVKVIGNEFENYSNSLENIYEIKTEDGSYLCGPYIYDIIDNNETLYNRYSAYNEQGSNYSYFTTKEYEANALACISLALVKAEEQGIVNLSDIDSNNIYLIIELPHSAMESVAASVVNQLAKKHTVTLTDNVTEESKVYNLSFELKENKMIIISQVIACLIGYMTDADGYEIDSLKGSYPTLVIDAGYYTVGDFTISRAKEISGAKSNINYGMMAIDNLTAEKINQKYGTSFKGYDMKRLFDKDGEDGKIIVIGSLSKSGNNEVHDVKKLYEETKREVFNQYIEYLDKKHNSFQKIKMILFGGGTGELYYKLFMEIADKYSNVKPLLVEYDLENSKVTPREAISAGGYKMLLNKLL